MSFRRYRRYRHGEFIVVGADTAAGGLDWCAAQFISKASLDVPVVYHSKSLATDMTPAIHVELETIHDQTGVQPTVAFERNNGGVFEMERLATLNRNGKYNIFMMPTYGQGEDNPEAKKLGWDTNSATRPKMLQDLKQAVDGKLIRFWDKPTITEMFSFVVVPTSTAWRAQAEKGAHDDLVMALAIAWQLYQSENPPRANDSYFVEEEVFTKDGFFV
jgi:hypothetical protein